jgi:hypothetical protein
MTEKLPDWAYLDSELDTISENIVLGDRYGVKPVHMCWYELWKNGRFINKAVLLAVEDVDDGRDALDRMIGNNTIKVEIGKYGEAKAVNNWLVYSVYDVLERYRYNSSIEFIGDNRLYNYEKWMAELV